MLSAHHSNAAVKLHHSVLASSTPFIWQHPAGPFSAASRQHPVSINGVTTISRRDPGDFNVYRHSVQHPDTPFNAEPHQAHHSVQHPAHHSVNRIQLHHSVQHLGIPFSAASMHTIQCSIQSQHPMDISPYNNQYRTRATRYTIQ